MESWWEVSNVMIMEPLMEMVAPQHAPLSSPTFVRVLGVSAIRVLITVITVQPTLHAFLATLFLLGTQQT